MRCTPPRRFGRTVALLAPHYRFAGARSGPPTLLSLTRPLPPMRMTARLPCRPVRQCRHRPARRTVHTCACLATVDTADHDAAPQERPPAQSLWVRLAAPPPVSTPRPSRHRFASARHDPPPVIRLSGLLPPKQPTALPPCQHVRQCRHWPLHVQHSAPSVRTPASPPSILPATLPPHILERPPERPRWVCPAATPPVATPRPSQLPPAMWLAVPPTR